ncbi:MAG: pyridoxamine 5'-phosphate oxidase family protein [Victivallales bacterium]|nr:pyridoxamine 5'-phosphate oxidase family protein [Victivallales bacterium]
MSIQKTYEFIKAAKTYFIATVDKDQPRVRPFGTIHIFNGKLYIQTGRKKNVAKQLLANGKTELCAMKGDEWIRVSGELVDDILRDPKASMLEEYPQLKSMYSADDDNTMVLYFKPGTVTATIYSFSHEPIVMTF